MMNFQKIIIIISGSLAVFFILLHLFTQDPIAGFIGYISLLVESIMLLANALKKNRKTEDGTSSEFFQTDETDHK